MMMIRMVVVLLLVTLITARYTAVRTSPHEFVLKYITVVVGRRRPVPTSRHGRLSPRTGAFVVVIVLVDIVVVGGAAAAGVRTPIPCKVNPIDEARHRTGRIARQLYAV